MTNRERNDHTLVERIKAYARLGRSQTAVLTGAAPVLGAVAAGCEPSWYFLPLFLIGAIGHLFGFAMNEIFDLRVDRLSPELVRKPLVRGEITVRQGTIFTVVLFVLSYGIGALFFHSREALLCLALSALFGSLYNMLGKKIPMMDLPLALSMGLLTAYGAIALQGISPSPMPPATETVVIALLLALQLLVQNLTAGLKDIRHDRLAGARTTPIVLGVSARTDGTLVRTTAFRLFLVIFKAARSAVLLIPAVAIHGFHAGTLRLGFLVVLEIALWMRWGSLVSSNTARERKKFLKLLGQHEVLSFLSLAVLMFPTIGWVGFCILLVVPPLWAALFLRWLHEGRLPDV